jgi:c-di-GMP-binding flagellar brake protein YcgR
VKKPKKVTKPKKATPSKKAAQSKKEIKLKKTAKPKKAAQPKKTVITRRQFPRVKAPVLYRAVSTAGSKHKISDISLGGIRIFSNERIRKGKRLEMELFLPKGYSLTVTAKVVWVRPLPKGSASPFDMGLEFISLPPNAMTELKTVLEIPSSGE